MPESRAPRAGRSRSLHSDQVWDEFVSREPYFAILTQPRFLRANFDQAAQAEFFQSGEGYVAELLPFLATRVAPRFQPANVLEYGCGVGRLAIPFARRAARVTGVDISPSMLQIARRHAEREDARNVDFVGCEDFETDPRRFDLVNCFLVLQRMRPAAGLALLAKLASRVAEGGIGVFHLPYRAHVPPLVRLTRMARRFPGINAAMNLARHKPASMPFLEAHAYDLNDVFAVLQEGGFETPIVSFLRHGDLDGLVIHVFRRHRPGTGPLDGAPAPEEPGTDSAHFIDVRRMIAETPIEELNRTAEEYFSSLKDWEHHLAKPFARTEDTPQLLIGLGVLLQGLALVPGMTVLEFGAGTGWLSRYLTQLGCRMILLDVSPSALHIARELFAKQPVFGARPHPEFLVFDGRRIDLPDASVDRIICFDAFHHAPNPADVIREFGRVLKPGGIAGFAEPGPNHSRTPQSQFEMRTYRVLENDVDISAIWEAATAAGFVDLQMAAYNIPPFHVSLAEYEELLAGGHTFARWAESTRDFLTGVRSFFLRTSGTGEIDSRSGKGLQATIEAEVAGEVRRGQPIPIRATITNSGRAKWLPSTEEFGGVSLGCHLYDGSGRLINLDYDWQHLPRALDPGESLEIEFALPAVDAGSYTFELDCVANKVAWFTQAGSQPLRLRVVVP